MPSTNDVRETIRARAQREACFRPALLSEAVKLLLTGDVGAGQRVIRNYINATVSFHELAERVHTSEKSLMCLFGPRGNPHSKTCSASSRNSPRLRV